MKRSAQAQWLGDLKSGTGAISTVSITWRPPSMACVRVSRQLMRWRLASSFALATALLFATPARAQDGSARSVLVIPVQSHWLAAPLSETVTEAVVEALSGAGYSVAVLRPEASLLRITKPKRPVSRKPEDQDTTVQYAWAEQRDELKEVTKGGALVTA